MSRNEAQIDNLTRHPQFPVGDNTFSITLAQLLLELLQVLTFKPLHTATPTSSVTLPHVTRRVPRAQTRVRIESPKLRSWRSHTTLGVRQRRGFSPDATHHKATHIFNTLPSFCILRFDFFNTLHYLSILRSYMFKTLPYLTILRSDIFNTPPYLSIFRCIFWKRFHKRKRKRIPRQASFLIFFFPGKKVKNE